MLQCGQGAAAGQSEIAVSIRPHEIRLAETDPGGEAANRVRGRVQQQVYLGATRDYLVQLPGDATVRVLAPRELDIPAGRDVTVEFPPAACRALRQ
jgi:iron(III) transport system ATP-binding protein